MNRKIITTLGVMLGAVMLTGCASASLFDFVMPTRVPPAMEMYLEHDVANFKGITTSAIVKGHRLEMDVQHKLEVAKYGIASYSTDVVITATNKTRDNLLALAATLGLGTASVGIPIAARKVPKGYSKD